MDYSYNKFYKNIERKLENTKYTIINQKVDHKK